MRKFSIFVLFQVVFQQSSALAPLAVDAVLKVIDPKHESSVNLSDIKVSVVKKIKKNFFVFISFFLQVIKQLGGTVEDTELIEGLVFPMRTANVNGPKKVEKAKIGFIQFCVSPPKTDMDHNVIVSDYAAMDR